MQNRELSWLKFNERVLEEACAQDVPLYERLRFISIFTSNMDEFFMVRVGSLFDLAAADKDAVDNKTGMSPAEQLEKIYQAAEPLYKKRDRYFHELEAAMRKFGIYALEPEELSEKEAEFAREYYLTRVLPTLSPQIVDDHHPFPFVANKKTYVVLELQKKRKQLLGLLSMPNLTDQILFLPGEGIRYVHVMRLVYHYAEEVFSAYTVGAKNLFCVTRNADINLDDEESALGDDFREKMKKLVQKRNRLSAVRLESRYRLIGFLLDTLSEKLSLRPEQMYLSRAPFSMQYVQLLRPKFSAALAEEMCYAPFSPQLSRNGAFDMRGRDVLLSFPYESMQPFLRLIRQSAYDPDVVSIQITIYRLSQNAKLIDYLCAAAENGKEVLVLIELRARFDEKNNIDWSEQLERAGCRVIYGFEEYKVHSKICLITRAERGGFRYITQIGTGNYNEKTAELYTDLSLMTANQEIGRDAANFFKNMAIANLEGHYDTLIVAPKDMKTRLMELIDEEMQKGDKGKILLKLNSITDFEMIEKLSQASCAGVRITMLVRGICCILPGIPQATENIRVFSIIGRFLEHSRIYSFGTGAEQKLYISSADLMTRNMQRRVEVACPILARDVKARINRMLEVLFSDRVKARELMPDGSYTFRTPRERVINAQAYFMEEALSNKADQAAPREGVLHKILKKQVTRWYRSLTKND